MLFGPDVCANFLRQEGFELLIRSHEPAHNGYDAFLNEGVPCMQVLTTALLPPPLRYDGLLGGGLARVTACADETKEKKEKKRKK